MARGVEILKEIQETYHDDNLIVFTGYDECILGYHKDSERVVYSVQQILFQLKKETNESNEEVFDNFAFNFQGNMIKDNSPILAYDVTEEFWNYEK